MPVPNTNTFSLNDVRNELGLSSTASLQSCFNAACDAGFRPEYVGSKDRQSNFRGYDDSKCSGSNTLTVTPSILPAYASTGGGQNVGVTSNTNWNVSSKPSWITVTGASGSGNDPVVTLTASNNTTGSQRNGIVQFRTTSGTPVLTRNVSVSQLSGFE